MLGDIRTRCTSYPAKRKYLEATGHADEPPPKRINIRLLLNPPVKRPQWQGAPITIHTPDSECTVDSDDEDNDPSFTIKAKRADSKFRLRPTLKNSKLLARRKSDSPGNLAGITLVAHEGNTISLLTPLSTAPGCVSNAGNFTSTTTAIDSGYFSYRSVELNSSPEEPQQSVSPTIALSKPEEIASVKQYQHVIHAYTEKLFMKKVVRKQYPFNPEKAREDLKPVMARLLDPPATRSKIVLLVTTDSEGNKKIKAIVKTVPLKPRGPGKRRRDATSVPYSDYFEAGNYHDN